MIKAILIDDEPAALQFLQWQLHQHCPQVHVVRGCYSAAEGIAGIRESSPQLVFLDIEMPGQNGFEVLRAFDHPDFAVIFTTAYNEFAIKAFKFAAFDYLLKPVDADDLKASIARYEAQRGGNSNDEKFRMLMEHYMHGAATGGRIALSTTDGMIMLKPEDVIRCQGISNYTKFFLTSRKQITVTKTLKETEEILHGGPFFRIHKSHLVNLNHIVRYLKDGGGSVLMSDGEEIAISRSRKDDLMQHFARI